MIWNELEDGCHDYAQQTKYATNKNAVYHKVQIVLDFMKVYQYAEAKIRASRVSYEAKQLKYASVATLMSRSWYREHIYGTVEHEIAGVIMKIAIYTRQFGDTLTKWDSSLDGTMELGKILHKTALVQNEVATPENIAQEALKKCFSSNSEYTDILYLLSGIGAILQLMGIEDIEQYIEHRLKYSFLKAIRDGRIK